MALLSHEKPSAKNLGSSLSKGRGEADGDVNDLKLSLKPTGKLSYSNAQWDDYRDLKRKDFQNGPELIFECEAKWSGPDDLIGTSGFGFWNDPFLMTGWRWPALPQAFWFLFETKRSKLSFEDAQKHQVGLSAMVVDAKHVSCFLWMLFCALTFPLLLWSTWRNWMRTSWPKMIKQTRSPLDIDIKKWQHYKLKWEANKITFWLNDVLVLEQKVNITEAQGLVIWMDNQYAVVEPWGVWSFGSEPIEQEQSLELRSIRWGKAK